MKQLNKYRLLFAGGGTGGHLFPALAVAEQVMVQQKDVEIVFVGRKDKLEAKIVPQCGYEFYPIIVQGFYRYDYFKNAIVLLKFFIGFFQSLALCMRLKPQVVVSTGGYIAGPATLAAKFFGAKVLLIEPNSFPGITTRLLERKADEIHLAFSETMKYLRCKEKLFVTGNPVRSSLQLTDRRMAAEHFGLNPDSPVLLVMGGSLGAKSFNMFIAEHLEYFKSNKIQLIWQTGKAGYADNLKYASPTVYVTEFISEMQQAFSAATMLLSRSGATIVAEIGSLGIPSILVPSPNVAENHQYYNAKALENLQAAIVIEEKSMKEKLFAAIFETIHDKNLLQSLSENAKKFSNAKTSAIIAERVLKLADSLKIFS